MGSYFADLTLSSIESPAVPLYPSIKRRYLSTSPLVNYYLLLLLLYLLLMVCHRVASRARVFSNQKSVLVCFIRQTKSRVLSVSGVFIKVFQVNSQYDVISGCQTVKIIVSEPELAVQISKSIFVEFPTKIEVNRAVQTSLKNCPTSTFRGHVTQHMYWFAAIWIDFVHATGGESILKKLSATLCLFTLLKGKGNFITFLECK